MSSYAYYPSLPPLPSGFFGSSPGSHIHWRKRESEFLRPADPYKRIRSFTLFRDTSSKMELPLAKTGRFSQHTLSIFYADKLCHETPSKRWWGKRKRKEDNEGERKTLLCWEEAVMLSIWRYRTWCPVHSSCWVGIWLQLLVRFARKKQELVQC